MADVSELEGGREPGFRHARTVFFAVSGAALVALLLLAQEVLLPFLLAILVAYVLFPAVAWVERRRVPRWAAILLVYLVMIGSMVGFAVLVVPRLFDETKQLSTELPKLTQRISEEWLPKLDARLQAWVGDPTPEAPSAAADEEDGPPIVIRPRDDGSYEIDVLRDVTLRKRGEGAWVLGPPREDKRGFSSERILRDGFDGAVAFVQRNSLEVLKIGRSIVAGVSRGVFYFFITLMLAGYMMFTYERILGFVRETCPEPRRLSLDRFIHRLDRGLAGVVRGQLLICLVNGVLSAIGFWIFDLKYWPILSLIAAVMSIIPIFGSILSTIPAVAIGLTQTFGTAMGVLIWIVAIHQLEANFLNPKIIGDQAKIHPVLVVFALLLGEHLFQITGALLAVPTLALAQAVFLHFRESVLGLSAGRISRTSLMPPAMVAAASGGVRRSSSPPGAHRPSSPAGGVHPGPLDDTAVARSTADDDHVETRTARPVDDGDADPRRAAVKTTLRSEVE